MKTNEKGVILQGVRKAYASKGDWNTDRNIAFLAH